MANITHEQESREGKMSKARERGYHGSGSHPGLTVKPPWSVAGTMARPWWMLLQPLLLFSHTVFRDIVFTHGTWHGSTVFGLFGLFASFFNPLGLKNHSSSHTLGLIKIKFAHKLQHKQTPSIIQEIGI